MTCLSASSKHLPIERVRIFLFLMAILQLASMLNRRCFRRLASKSFLQMVEIRFDRIQLKRRLSTQFNRQDGTSLPTVAHNVLCVCAIEKEKCQ